MKKTVLTLAILFAAVLTAAAQEMPWFMPKVDASQYKGKVKEVQYRYIEMRDERHGNTTFGVGVSSNITRASIRSLFSAYNRLIAKAKDYV